MKKVANVLLLMLASIFIILGIFMLIGTLTYDTPQTHDVKGVLFGFVVFCFAIGILLIFLARKVLKKETTASLSSRSPRLFDPAQGLQAVIPSGLILRANEECFLIEPVKAARSKEITAGYAGRSAGLSVRVAKGVTLHSGANRGVPIKKTVLEKYNGTLYITSQRIILTAPKFGFEKKLSSLVNVTQYQDGLSFQFGSTSYLILTAESLYIHGLLNHVIDTYLYKANETPQL